MNQSGAVLRARLDNILIELTYILRHAYFSAFHNYETSATFIQFSIFLSKFSSIQNSVRTIILKVEVKFKISNTQI